MIRRPVIHAAVAVFVGMAANVGPVSAQALFFSEYIEGTANNRGLELYNPGATPVDLVAENYMLRLYVNGDSTPTTTFFLSGTVPAHGVYIIAHSAASFAGIANQIFSSLTFNGDDAIALVRNGVEVDVIGQEGFDPGQGWGVAPYSTVDHTLRRRPWVCSGDSNGLDNFEPNLNSATGEWDTFPIDSSGGLGSHTANCASSFIVTNNNDAGPGSLRQAILDANALSGTDSVQFDPAFFSVPRTITLTSGEIPITDSVVIQGPAAALTISGNNTSRIFQINVPGAGSVTLSDLTMIQGLVNAPNRGGAIEIQDEQVTLTNCTFSNNKSLDAGGAIVMQMPGGSLSVNSCSFTSNTATAGGAIAAYGQVGIALTSSSFIGNQAIAGGAINQNSGGSLTVTACTFHQNFATSSDGGAIFLNSAFNLLQIRNSTLNANSAFNNGGAIGLGTSSSFATLAIENCTITGNGATIGSGGAIARAGGTATINLNSCIVSSNIAGNGGSQIFTTGVVNATACLVQAIDGISTFSSDSFTNSHIGVNPLVGPIANNGGPMLTRTLLHGSPARDNGQNPSGLTLDQRGQGYARVRDGNCDSVAAIDIGAVEVQFCCPADIGGDDAVNVSDLLAVINGWGPCPAPPGTCAADVAPPAGDGVVNVSDLLTVINGWGACH